MNILLCERISYINQYIELLANAYKDVGHSVIFDVQNFLYSDFIPDFVHIQWPEAIYSTRHCLPPNDESLALLENRLKFYSKNSVPIVFTIHNILPHDSKSEFDKAFYANIMRYSNILVHHGNESVKIIKELYPESKSKNHIICPHGPYPAIKVKENNIRKIYKLPQNKYIFLNFGLQRSYKGYDFTKKVFKKLPNNDVYLFTIGGKKYNLINNSFYRQIIKGKDVIQVKNNLSLSKRKRTITKTVKQTEIPYIIEASDVFFLGHQKGLNSGILALAASYGKPIIYPELGNFKEQLRDYTWQESYEAGNINSAIDAIKKMKEKISFLPPGNIVMDNSEWLKNNSWKQHVENIINAVQKEKVYQTPNL